MPLETLSDTGSEDTNIGAIVLEDPPVFEELPFDVERDLGEEGWQRMKRELERYKRVSQWSHIAWQIQDMSLLYPERRGELELELLWPSLHTSLLFYKREAEQNEEWRNYASFAFLLKVVFPDHIREIPRAADVWNGCVKQFRDLKSNWKQATPLVKDLRVLFPKHADKFAPPEYLTSILSELESCRQSGSWVNFAQTAPYVKWLFPQHAHRIPLDDIAWKHMREALDNLSDQASFALNLKILAAESIQVTRKHVHIIMPQPRRLHVDTPLPTLRSF